MLLDWQQIEREIVWTAVRSRGPGGQNVNKVSSAAQLNWDFQASQALTVEQKSLLHRKLVNRINQDGQVYLRSDEYRDLPRNQDRCLAKLKEMVAQAFHKPKPRRATKPTRASKIRKRESKTKRGETKKWRQKVKY
jgi:ribosome-associated protein